MNRTLSLRKESILRLSCPGENLGQAAAGAYGALAGNGRDARYLWPTPTLSTSLTTID